VTLAHSTPADENQIGPVTQNTNWAGAYILSRQYSVWGEPLQTTNLQQEFTGLQGYESSLDQDQALYRRYVPRLGRWFTPDPLAGDITNPQSFNRYAYVLSNPTTLTDPLGLGQCPPGTSPMGTGQCRGIEGPGSGNNQVGPSTTCEVDGVEDKGCLQVQAASQFDTLLFTEAMLADIAR
jgi:RHS repeat-associated protein